MKLPRINFKNGTTLSEVKKLYPDLEVFPLELAGCHYLRAQVNVPGLGFLVFIFDALEFLTAFEILPSQHE